MHIVALNGPNLNLLGVREPAIYGRLSFAELEAMVRAEGDRLGITLEWFQTNHEGEFVDRVQALKGRADGALVNAAALTHTSLAVRDAFLAVEVPFVEVHLSNLFAREAERRHSRLADLAIGLVTGFGPDSYLLGLRGLVGRLRER